ncbi:mitochondrial genome maintenance protein MGM101 [Boeremia exigua]|uniref:mitochondrial genome maintenance protein MGM101 n=1 Tax=Boeremia exigua TaxID=749465 RepID=UPI001E8D4E6F|nr:mitochondrial genome maintenance protein MGM101 [Boeremia exigua]KAH6616725.1 mitochondrial genome maintenance protein MGM101 [Boeremia exigua]
MAATPARRGAFQLLASSPRTTIRSFSSSRISAAFTSTPKAQTTSTTTATKPATVSSGYKPATSTASTVQRTVVPSFPAKEPPVPTYRSTTAASATSGQRSLTDGLSDAPAEIEGVAAHDWTRSYYGLGSVSFSNEQAEILLAPVKGEDVEVKPDGILYLPEIKYRRILNKAFGPGGWGLAPRGESIVTSKLVTREYGMVVQGRLVSIARGEQQYFDADGIPTATEGCKSNALMRCCKDLGIASELWDPRFIREFNTKFTKEVWVEHVSTKKKRKIVIRKDDVVKYPFKESKMGA